MLSIIATKSLTKGQPWRPERSTCVGPPSTTDSPSPDGIEPHVSQTTALSSPAPTGHLSNPQTISETHGPHPLRVALPQASDPASPESEPPVPNSRSGQMSPIHPTPVPGLDTATMLPPIGDNPPNRGLFDGPLLSRGAVRPRLVGAKRQENNRRRINTAKNNLCSWITDRLFALLHSQSPHRLGPLPLPPS